MTRYIILFFLFFKWSNNFGQIDKIKIKKLDSSSVVLSLAKMTEGIIKVSNLTKDPILRLEFKGDKNYSLKKYDISFNINGELIEKYQCKETKLTSEQINILRSAKKGFENKLLIENAIAVDEIGNEIILNRIRLKIKVN